MLRDLKTARRALGDSPTPGQIVAWAREQARARAPGRTGGGVAGRVRCGQCAGTGVTPDGSAWCDHCRLGWVDATHQCPVCLGAERVGADASGPRGRSVPCPACCGAQAVVYSRLRRAGVPSKYQVLTMDGWVERVAAIQPEEARPQYRAALAAARRLARFQAPPEGERAGLLLSGPPGRMKSGLAAAVVVEASRLGAQARWLAWGSYCDQLNELREAGQSVRDEIEAVAGAELLVVDDLGADGIVSDWRTRILVDLLERRGSPPGRVLPTIVTTMLRLDDLSSRYGDHAASRLLEVCAPIALTGLDARRNKA